VTAILDGIKGAIPVAVAVLLHRPSDPPFIPALVGLAAVAGHNWPLFLRFRGGKGVATSGGVILVLAPVALVCSVAAWLVGARLAQAGMDVALVGRAPHMETVAREGVRIRVAGKATSQPVQAARQSVAELSGAFDYVLLTVKGYDTGAALDEIHHLLRPGTI